MSTDPGTYPPAGQAVSAGGPAGGASADGVGAGMDGGIETASVSAAPAVSAAAAAGAPGWGPPADSGYDAASAGPYDTPAGSYDVAEYDVAEYAPADEGAAAYDPNAYGYGSPGDTAYPPQPYPPQPYEQQPNDQDHPQGETPGGYGQPAYGATQPPSEPAQPAAAQSPYEYPAYHSTTPPASLLDDDDHQVEPLDVTPRRRVSSRPACRRGRFRPSLAWWPRCWPGRWEPVAACSARRRTRESWCSRSCWWRPCVGVWRALGEPVGSGRGVADRGPGRGRFHADSGRSVGRPRLPRDARHRHWAGPVGGGRRGRDRLDRDDPGAARPRPKARAGDRGFRPAMVLTVTMVGYGASIALVRNQGAGVLAGFLAMAGAAALLSHATDAALPRPAIAPGVPRGLVGLAIGAVGAAGAGVLVAKLVAIGPLYAGLLGLGVGLVTMLLDLGQAYAVAGRLAAGEQLAGSTIRPLLGPCLALAMTILGAWTYGAVVL
ncbi:hypothetical protein [Fodinicola feengrottensis]|uniref:hypothetical protein n=1 Tax=Fodinicola feengrottensis TaxID=435914 RepID=UPI0013D7171A|nr:hypothetical protein [Fodinicola feengrottensis]